MSIVAKGMITLSSVNDAYSIHVSPSTCIIKADFDGSNPQLENAYTDIKVIQGNHEVKLDAPTLLGVSNGTSCSLQKIDDFTWRLLIEKISTDTINGEIAFEVKVGDGYSALSKFTYTVLRESSSLQWIQDWNGTYTEISGKWVITPKIFAGTKNEAGKISGTYLGPGFDGEGNGIFGYKDGLSIFKITETGASIGGWQIENGGIQTSDGKIKILSEGTIESTDNGVVSWSLNKNGSATFAKGNVSFESNGNAWFTGSVTAVAGRIGGWDILEDRISTQSIILDSYNQIIGLTVDFLSPGDSTDRYVDSIHTRGGMYMYTNGSKAFGFKCYTPSISADTSDTELVFSLGDENQIAGWTFDKEAFYIGSKCNIAHQNTSSDSAITIGTAGIRGCHWYIDTNGDISFIDGLMKFTKEGGTIANWNMRSNALVTQHVALVSSQSEAGLYLSKGNLNGQTIGSYPALITQNGGVFLQTDGANTQLSAYKSSDNGTQRIFSLNTDGLSQISAWFFTENSLYIGNENNKAGEFTANSNSITIGANGIRGHKWRLEKDGSGALAGGNISWDAEGNTTLSSKVSVSWSQITGTDVVTNKLTKIDATGIYTGTISAKQINADELLSVEGKWALKSNGSGYLATKNIEWDANGNLDIQGNLLLKSLRYESDYNPTASPQPYEGAFIYLSLAVNNLVILPHLEPKEFKSIKMLIAQDTRSTGVTTIATSMTTDKVYEGASAISTLESTSCIIGEPGYYEAIGHGAEISAINPSGNVWRIIKIA